MATANYSDAPFDVFSSETNLGDEQDYLEDDNFNFFLNKITRPILFGSIAFVGAIGNSLVIYVILSRERMRTVTNILLLNLAISDLAFVIVVPPSTAFQYATLYWPFGDVTCRMMHYLVNVTAYVTVYTLVVVALMRYLTIVHSTSTARFRTRYTTVRLIAALWLVVSAANIPVLLSYQVKMIPTQNLTGIAPSVYGSNDSVPECDLTDERLGKPLFGALFTFGYLIPLSLIALLSLRIVVSIRRQRGAVSDGVRKVRSQRKQPVGRTLVLVVVLFAALWLPVHLQLLIWFFGEPPEGDWYEVVSVLFYCLAYSNSCVNPFVYNHTSKDFRDSFRSVILSTFRYGLGTGSNDRRSKRVDDHQLEQPPSPDFDETIAINRTAMMPPKNRHRDDEVRAPCIALEPLTTINHVVTNHRAGDDDDNEYNDVVDVVFSNSALLSGTTSASEPIECCPTQKKKPSYSCSEQRGYVIMTSS